MGIQVVSGFCQWVEWEASDNVPLCDQRKQSLLEKNEEIGKERERLKPRVEKDLEYFRKC